MKIFIFTLLFFCSLKGNSQYIGVRARYTETKVIDDAPNPPKRENRLILSFYEVTGAGIYLPISLNNYDIWVYKQGLQYGNVMGGVLDSTGNNYPGYEFTAPKVVSYYNSYVPHYIDCSNVATQFTVNGHELDCGFVTVSYWETDQGNGNFFEAFPAPNVCLPYYFIGHPYSLVPGNVNFSWPAVPTPPYNWYSFACAQSTQQLVIRGVLPHDTNLLTLPVLFDKVEASLTGQDQVRVSWSNLTESDINYYEVQRSEDGRNFSTIGINFPLYNNGSTASYEFVDRIPGHRKVLFYRIKALEQSNNYFFSAVLSVVMPQHRSNNFTIYPNPVVNKRISLRVTNLPRGIYAAILINTAGQRTKIKNIHHAGGALTDTFELPNVLTGMYTILLRSAEISISRFAIIK